MIEMKDVFRMYRKQIDSAKKKMALLTCMFIAFHVFSN